ncbi:hypothetical protein [Daejeonella lutea]|uniref:Uncharacterized protein n=1 Tax=Daejeonella lutea TaxID=572036 RepID=A0A1T4ZX40_9SPHI|nr:hypothetical protein [Daejeonella lutea]SKB27165.1 hypothetical protein SAMN05661099_0024 [Daejeonella lutea]
MKYLLILFIALSLTGCEREECCLEPDSRNFKIEATGQKFDLKVTRRITGTSNEIEFQNLTNLSDPFSYNFTPEIGKTYKIYLSGAGLTSWKVIYRGKVLASLASPGTGVVQDFEIKD